MVLRINTMVNFAKSGILPALRLLAMQSTWMGRPQPPFSPLYLDHRGMCAWRVLGVLLSY